jgi:hypothetical protein
MIPFISGFYFSAVGARLYILKEKQRVNGGERVKLRTLPYFQSSDFNLEIEHPTTHCIKEVLIITKKIIIMKYVLVFLVVLIYPAILILDRQLCQ